MGPCDLQAVHRAGQGEDVAGPRVRAGVGMVIMYPSWEREAYLQGKWGLHKLGRVGGGGIRISPHSRGAEQGVNRPRWSSDNLGTPCRGEWRRLATAPGHHRCGRVHPRCWQLGGLPVVQGMAEVRLIPVWVGGRAPRRGSVRVVRHGDPGVVVVLRYGSTGAGKDRSYRVRRS